MAKFLRAWYNSPPVASFHCFNHVLLLALLCLNGDTVFSVVGSLMLCRPFGAFRRPEMLYSDPEFEVSLGLQTSFPFKPAEKIRNLRIPHRHIGLLPACSTVCQVDQQRSNSLVPISSPVSSLPTAAMPLPSPTPPPRPTPPSSWQSETAPLLPLQQRSLSDVPSSLPARPTGLAAPSQLRTSLPGHTVSFQRGHPRDRLQELQCPTPENFPSHGPPIRAKRTFYLPQSMMNRLAFRRRRRAYYRLLALAAWTRHLANERKQSSAAQAGLPNLPTVSCLAALGARPTWLNSLLLDRKTIRVKNAAVRRCSSSVTLELKDLTQSSWEGEWNAVDKANEDLSNQGFLSTHAQSADLFAAPVVGASLKEPSSLIELRLKSISSSGIYGLPADPPVTVAKQPLMILTDRINRIEE
ncbi:unnamed protein product [Protopolystoma xenopodis]|uniref:Uncharacterized protein n=1 Tax=Protopolystoma xenopodis TaxID=117903 RepID=A0A3S5A8U6_9PLAT|nr:unnamed protein product [Protopolystoma xenopodis]